MRSFHVAVPDLTAVLLSLVKQLPKGKVATYGDLATALGDRAATRWVATVLLDPPQTLSHINHRVVRATGEPPTVPANSLALLTKEGVPISQGRIDLTQARFTDFDLIPPLKQLKEDQSQLAKRVRLTKLRSKPKLIAGIDVSYRADGTGVGAYVLMKPVDTAPIWTKTITSSTSFPYIPGYLSYRELPIHAELLKAVTEANRIAPVLLVDGNGILHPRRTGIATQLGVHADHPTIGVSKSLLCGSAVMDNAFGEGTGRIVHKSETIAAVLPPSRRGKRPIYVSPGHRCTLEEAVEIVNAYRFDLRLPEPIRIADSLSRATAKAGLEPF